MRLIDAPVGVFRFSGDLVLKTEYMVDIDGVWIPDCYILDSGEKFWGGMKSTEDFKTKYNDLEVEVIDVEPQKMRGKWVEVNDYYNRISGKCSVCGWESHMYEDDVVGMNFCPNCGAWMGGQDET